MINQFEGWLSGKQGFGAMLLRVTLGVVFLMHGYLAMFVYTPAGMAQFFGSVGVPFPLFSAWLLGLMHLAGGTMLLLGLFTRINALVHTFIMAVATVKVHLAQGFFMSGIIIDATNGVAIAGGYEYALTLALASLGLAFIGGGSYALERRLGLSTASQSGDNHRSGPITQS